MAAFYNEIISDWMLSLRLCAIFFHANSWPVCFDISFNLFTIYIGTKNKMSAICMRATLSALLKICQNNERQPIHFLKERNSKLALLQRFNQILFWIRVGSECHNVFRRLAVLVGRQMQAKDDINRHRRCPSRVRAVVQFDRTLWAHRRISP